MISKEIGSREMVGVICHYLAYWQVSGLDKFDLDI